MLRVVSALSAGLVATPVAGLLAPSSAAAATFDEVDALARERSQMPHQPQPTPAQKWVTGLSYEQAVDITYRPDRGVKLPGGPFEARFFHLAHVQRYPVRMHVSKGEGYKRLEYDESLFEFGKTPKPPEGAEMDFAGFRLLYPLNHPYRMDELLVFQGASYFRALAKGQWYGLSHRGIAIDTALPGEQEEFPAFVEMWVGPADEGSVQVFALLDGPSVTGAYSFHFYPGKITRADVRARIYLRKEVAQLGIAPLTSMFLHGDAQPSPADDYRPEVHDSDTLVMQYPSGERVARPLRNPLQTTVSTFVAPEGLSGYGLVQRDRDFDHYQELETKLERRPSTWVTPVEGFGSGRIQLIEIATRLDSDDNISMLFQPDNIPPPGEPMDFSYAIEWRDQAPPVEGLAEVVGTRHDGRGQRNRYIVDFSPPTKDGEKRARADLGIDASVSEGGNVASTILVEHPKNNAWRAIIDVVTPVDHDVEVRAHLVAGGKRVSEVWNYRTLTESRS